MPGEVDEGSVKVRMTMTAVTCGVEQDRKQECYREVLEL
jgi:metal-sulfur cluster biosynthetic enzyme